jgi:hypothetical protein
MGRQKILNWVVADIDHLMNVIWFVTVILKYLNFVTFLKAST